MGSVFALFWATSLSEILTDCTEKCTLELSYINVFLFVNKWNFLLKTLKMLIMLKKYASIKLYFDLKSKIHKNKVLTFNLSFV